MIIIMKPGASDEAVQKITSVIEEKGLQVHLSKGHEVTIVGVVGDKSRLHGVNLEVSEGVEKVLAVTESYKLANRKFHPEDSVIQTGNTAIGPGTLTIMAGPCAIESQDQLMETAFAVKKAGATFLRGGAYKPRTSPYSFQGLEEEGLRYMKEAGKTGLPILLKRGLCATIDEWLNAAEYIMSEDNPNVVLCERGIRTFETATRNTLDISAIPVLRSRTHLPVIVDPSHATGVRAYVEPLAKSAVAAGADGLMIEVHPNPACALSDGPQSLTFEQFGQLTDTLRPYADLEERRF